MHEVEGKRSLYRNKKQLDDDIDDNFGMIMNFSCFIFLNSIYFTNVRMYVCKNE